MRVRIGSVARFLTTFGLMACFGSALAQEPTIEVVYGGGNDTGNGIPATSARGSGTLQTAVAADGTIYISDESGRVRKITADGLVRTIGGSDSINCGFSGDGGAATSAEFCYPKGIALDSEGNVYVSDTQNNRIRKISSSGIITTIAGTTYGFGGDGGPAASARLYFPTGMVFDAIGNLYFSDTANDRVRRITPSGFISTVAGSGQRGLSGDGGAATAAALNQPIGLAFDGAGNLYVADRDNHRIRRVTTSGIISTIAGSGAPGGQGTFSGDGGPASEARLNQPTAVATDKAGSLFIADFQNFRIRHVDALGQISTIAGNGELGDPVEGAVATSTPMRPMSIQLDIQGRLLVHHWGQVFQWRGLNPLLRIALPSAGDLIVDDGATNSRNVARNQSSSASVWNSLSQTFTARSSKVAFGFRLYNRDQTTGALLPDAGKPIVMNLYSGENNHSNLLASKTVNMPAQLSTDARRNFFGDVGFVMADFSAVSLAVGGKYTVEITLPPTNLPAPSQQSNIAVWTSLANPYPDGRFYFRCCYDNSSFVNQDMLFKMTEAAASPVSKVEVVEESIVEAMDSGEISSGVANLLLKSLGPIQANLAWIAANPSSPDLARIKSQTCSLINQFNGQMDHYVRLRRLPAANRDVWKADMLDVKVQLGCN